MNTIDTNIQSVLKEIRETARSCGRNPDEVRLVGVSKKQPARAVTEAIRSGLAILGENYIQEAVDKIETIGPTRAVWHFIGHLQSNKAKPAVRYFDLIHTVDTLKLARAIHRQAEAMGKVQSVLIQVNISHEQTKSGTGPEAVADLAGGMAALPGLSVRGLMCMPPFFDDPERARPYFRALAGIRDAVAARNLPGVSMEHLSMGMSGDFKVAIQEGATLVRIGTALFGERG